jgi:hypothetical protein
MSATKIFGSAKEYANSEINFFKYTDRITYSKEQIFTIKFDDNGNFNLDVDVDEVTYVFSEFGTYYAYLYLEPNATYELLLPAYEEREIKDILNPLFEPEEIHLGIKNMKSSDLNYLILDFDYFYDKYLSFNFMDVYLKGIESNVDTFISNINSHFEDKNTNQYFNVYKDYRIANLKNMATHKEHEQALALVYFARDSVYYDNPAYMDLFNSMYSFYFDRYITSANLRKGNLLYFALNNGHSIHRIHKLLGGEELELRNNKQFRELVILKGINDAFSKGQLKWNPLLQTLDSIIMSTEFPRHKDIAQRIADNALTLSVNTVAPTFELRDAEGNAIDISNYRGRCIYLQFANTQSYSSQMEFGVLKKIYDRYKKECFFLTVLTDTDIKRAEKYRKRNNLDWKFVYAPVNSPVLSMYNVVSYPTYYLIDQSGMLKLSPAPSPSENFETVFFNILEKEKQKGKN